MKDQKALFSHIAAVSQNNVIGLKGQLPWHIPEDLKYFFNTTKNKALIMGRKSFESLGKPLPKRLNVVITRQKKFQPSGLNCVFVGKGQGTSKEEILALISQPLSLAICPSIKEAMDFCAQKELVEKYGREIFIAGGGEIYKQSLPLMDRLYITRIHKEYEGDAFYPDIPKNQFKEVSRIDRSEPAPFSFLIYERLMVT